MKGPLAILTVFLTSTMALAAAAPAGKTVVVKVDGTERQALVFLPASGNRTPAPVVFAFHGHGGTSAGVAEKWDYQSLWPEAIVVYPQGIPIASNTDPDGKKAGWQHAKGDAEDRDLKFFDELLARIRKDYKVDDHRIYATGQSNGGGFTYALWAARADVFAAFAPSAASSAMGYFKDLKPKPALHVAGEADKIVPFEKQRALMDAIRKLNGCDPAGKAWEGKAVLYPSASGTPLVELVHPAGHVLPPEAPALIVRFFKEHPAKP
jgi:polyhydroxybutyrate depolymerase